MLPIEPFSPIDTKTWMESRLRKITANNLSSPGHRLWGVYDEDTVELFTNKENYCDQTVRLLAGLKILKAFVAHLFVDDSQQMVTERT